jgi:type VI secretion system secreted protein Hcp
MSFDTYLKIEGCPGESTQAGHVGEIEILSWSFGSSNPSTVGPGSEGSGAGRVTISSFNFMKKVDKSSPDMWMKCCTGQHYNSALVTMNKATGGTTGQTQKPFLTYQFNEVFVDSIQWSGSTGGDDMPTESVSFSFGKIKCMYQKQDKTGQVGNPIFGGWDVQKVTPI